MSDVPHILIVEDVPTDAELAEREVRQVLPNCEVLRVETREEFLAALSSFHPDVILSDYMLPSFDGMAALKLAQEHTPDVPFILVTGSMNEETAVECMKAGACDYVIKEHLKRLGSALLSGLDQRRLRKEKKLAEQTLAESELRYRALADSGQALIWTSGADKLCDYFNQPWLLFTGRTMEQEFGNGWAEGVHPEDLARCLQIFHTAFDRREQFSMEYRLRHASGEYRWIQDVGKPRCDGKGAFLGYIGHCLDITERKQAEEALRKSERRHRIVADNTYGWEFWLDPQGRFLYCSPSCKRITGQEAAAFVADATLMNRIIHPDDQVRYAEHAKEARETKRACEIEFRIVRPDGAERWIGHVCQPILDENGASMGIRGSNHDITERKQAESERKLLTTAIEQAAETVIITDTQGNIQYVNPAFESITGYTRAEALGQNPRFLKSGQQDAAFYRTLWSTIDGGNTWCGRLINKRKDGTNYTEEAAISPVRNEAGVIVNYVAVKRDVTQELNLEAQLFESQKMESIGRLAGGIAHDFNNLLTIINGYSDLVMQNLAGIDPLREQLTAIRNAGERAAGLTQQLLAFSRRQVIAPTVLNLNDVVTDTEKMLRRLIGEDIELKTILDESLGNVSADAGQLNQVLMNLTVNARDAMPDGGKLTFETSNANIDVSFAFPHSDVLPGRYVLLTVTDTGVGMDRQTLQNIFEPFFTTKKPGTGTGLGLATVYGILKQSKGWIWAESEPGQGTTFKLCFPRVDAPVDITVESKVADVESLGGAETILVVEDQVEVRQLAVEVLRSYGYQVLEAANGGDALLLCERNSAPIHLMVTDVIMPGMTGRELAQRLQQIRPDTKVLYISGYAAEVIANKGILEHGVAYLPKPFAPNSLARKVREVLGNRSSEKTILVVDDERGIRKLLHEILESAGYEVLEAANGKEAMRVVKNHEVDVVLTDIVMPEQEGIETVRALRTEYPQIRVIVMSGAFDGQYLKVAKMLGAHATLEKPILSHQLLQTVYEVMWK